MTLGLIDADVVGFDRSHRDESLDRVSPDSLDILPEAFSSYQELWYRVKNPHGEGSLLWWHLLARGLKVGGNIQAATRLLARHVATVTGTENLSKLPVLQAELAFDPSTVVVTRDEMDPSALRCAVERNAALVVAKDPTDATTALQKQGYKAVVSDPGDASPRRRTLLEAMPEGQPGLPEDLYQDARDIWTNMPEHDRSALLVDLQQRVAVLEQVRLITDTDILDNRDVAHVILECQLDDPDTWNDQQLLLATLAYCWNEAGFILQEFNQSLLSLPAVHLFLCLRLSIYLETAGIEQDRTVDGLASLVREVGRARKAVERTHWRCIHFDGSNWERREFLLPMSSLERWKTVPDKLADQLERTFGATFPGDRDSLEGWDQYLERVLSRGHTPTKLIQTVADWAANDETIPVDMAIFTVPIGVKLEEPYTLDITDVFCYTGFRNEFGSKETDIPLDRVGIHNAIGQRMRYNVVRKAQNYALVRRWAPQSFNLPDIAIAEDANHGGHTAAGIRLASRIPMPLTYRGRTWKGLGDVRLNRADYLGDHPFQPSEMPIGHRYVWWAKGIAEATYRRDLLFDTRWGDKVATLEEA